MKKIVFVKLGGSLITDKTGEKAVNAGNIENIAVQIKEILSYDNINLIIATGAGSFGHPVAEKYIGNLNAGREVIERAVLKLNKIVVDRMIKNGISAVSSKPSDFTSYDNGEIVNLKSVELLEKLESGITPVFHADLIVDGARGLSILSMDKFLVDMAVKIKEEGHPVDRIIFAGVTDGVISERGKTIGVINEVNYPLISTVFFKGRGIDVTGGMKFKVTESLRAAKSGIKCLIINGQDKDMLTRSVNENGSGEFNLRSTTVK